MVFCMSLIETPVGFIMGRFIIGLGLATFVANQFWASSLFSPNVVGLANATSAGWGNLGGGITQFLTSALYVGLLNSYSPFSAWRRVFFIHGCFHILAGLMVLAVGQDMPEGNYSDLKATGAMRKMTSVDATRVFYAGVLNYRTWILVLNYAFCFGVELTVNNIITPYFVDQFGLKQVIAGTIGGLFGFMNTFARSSGGLVSDMIGKKSGMRGRLWAYWLCQTLEGVACIAMGLAYKSLTATVILMIVFSFFVQASEGAAYGVVPFVSKRALGVVSGFVGAGGNAGAVINQRLWFFGDKYETYDGIVYMGILIICVTATLVFVHFPMWGGMFTKGQTEFLEEDYYLKDYTEEEIAAGYGNDAVKFAGLAREQLRGEKGLKDYESSVHGAGKA